jgi:nucleoside-diphosphate-sugar epimerase
MKRRILVTGASGYVGNALTEQLAARPDLAVKACFRSQPLQLNPGVEPCIVGDIHGATDWRPHLRDIDAVVHLAAHVHHRSGWLQTDARRHFIVNAQGTIHLARSAQEAGVKRLIFLSSLAVFGQDFDRPITERDPPAPRSPYGRSKLQAEQALRDLSLASEMEYIVLRPPLIYGPGAPGNLRSVVTALNMGLPLPFGDLNQRRSLIALPNLTSALETALRHPSPVRDMFLVADDTTLSPRELLLALARHANVRARTFTLPRFLSPPAINRLRSPACVDAAAFRSKFGWVPTVSPDSALRTCALAARTGWLRGFGQPE